MFECNKKATQWVARGWSHVEDTGKCGRTGVTGEPVYCTDCEREADSRGHAKHQCRHGVNMVRDDGTDGFCEHCH